MSHLYVRHSPSALNLFAAEPAMFVLERLIGIKQPVGAAAHRGTAIEAGVTVGLQEPKAAMKDCVDLALAKYDTLMAMSPDPRRDKYREPIPGMVEVAVTSLRQYGVPTSVQGQVDWKPPELQLPMIGFYDFEWAKDGIIADLKTTEKMPSEIKPGHARQVALYAASDNTRAHLIYVSPKKYEPYLLENVFEHRAALLNIAKRVEKFIALSDDPKFFLEITVPNLDSFYWNNPLSRQLAFEYWRI